MDPRTLETLVARIADGDQQALSDLYDATHAHVFGYARHVLGEDGSAEEATLDAFLQVWRESARFDRTRGSVMTWLMNLARSRTIDRLRAAGGRARQLERPLELASDAPSGDLAPAESTFLRERRERITAALARLPIEQREAIRCAFLLGMSHTEVARFTDQPLGTIKTRIRTGLLRLRELLHPLEASA